MPYGKQKTKMYVPQPNNQSSTVELWWIQRDAPESMDPPGGTERGIR